MVCSRYERNTINMEKHDIDCKKQSKKEYCCDKRPMQRFMETCLLMLLSKQESHGYYLTEQLKEFGFEDVNVSTLYRIMRKMDDRGWVKSSWAKGDKGPQRRVYSVTEDGLVALDEWIDVFKDRRKKIDLLVSRYENSKGSEE